MVTTILLWGAIYAGAKQTTGKTQLAGYDYHGDDRVLAADAHQPGVFVDAGVGGRHFARHPRRDAQEVPDPAARHARLPALLPGGPQVRLHRHRGDCRMPILFTVCASFFTHFPDVPTFAAYIASLLLAFLIGFHFEACIGAVGFWLLEVSSLLYIINTLNYFISGHMFPIDLLGEPWATILKALPTQYLAYFPAAVFLGKVQRRELADRACSGRSAGRSGLMLLSRLLYRVGPAAISALRRMRN